MRAEMWFQTSLRTRVRNCSQGSVLQHYMRGLTRQSQSEQTMCELLLDLCVA